MNFDVPHAESPSTCQYCGQPFPTERILRLHEGQEHSAALSEAEQLAVREALDEEASRLRRFRLSAVFGLVLLYFVFLFAYAVFA